MARPTLGHLMRCSQAKRPEVQQPVVNTNGQLILKGARFLLEEQLGPLDLTFNSSAEQRNGYIGVAPGAANLVAATLVSQINTQRRAAYQGIAKRNAIP